MDRWRSLALLVMIPASLLGVGAMTGWGESRSADPAEATPMTRSDFDRWADVAAEAEDLVPARVLLGAEGPAEELEPILARRAMTRSEFSTLARRVLHRYGSSASQVDTVELLVMVEDSAPLPDGASLLGDRAPRTPVRDERPELVDRLLARLPADSP